MKALANSNRRYDIDWLRVILFGLLIPFHVAIGIYWSTYGEEVNPNLSEATNEDREELAEDGNDYSTESIDFTSMILHWMHQWRLAALFMISGMGTAFAFRNRTYGRFLLERVKRLIVPMFFGMWVTGFVGGLILDGYDFDNGFSSLVNDLLEHIFWTSILFWVPVIGKIFALGHLWFLWNLFLYSLLLTPVFHFAQKYPSGKLVAAIKGIFSMRNSLGVMILIPLILASSEILFKPWFPGFIGIGYEWFWFAGFFLFGYCCIIAKTEYYKLIEQKRIILTCCAIASTLAFLWIRIQQHHDSIPYVDGGWIFDGLLHTKMTILACLIHSFHAWFWCLTIFAWGAHLLNRPSMRLAYLNQGVYPFYIVHMPLTFAGLAIAGEIGLTDYPAVIFGCIFVAATCWLLFEVLRRTSVTRFLFGIKPLK
tara:strand:- start:19 stop:1290 length:1272 start_codon:yes stop_codon:yes gene_type:complete